MDYEACVRHYTRLFKPYLKTRYPVQGWRQGESIWQRPIHSADRDHSGRLVVVPGGRGDRTYEAFIEHLEGAVPRSEIAEAIEDLRHASDLCPSGSVLVEVLEMYWRQPTTGVGPTKWARRHNLDDSLPARYLEKAAEQIVRRLMESRVDFFERLFAELYPEAA